MKWLWCIPRTIDMTYCHRKGLRVLTGHTSLSQRSQEKMVYWLLIFPAGSPTRVKLYLPITISGTGRREESYSLSRAFLKVFNPDKKPNSSNTLTLQFIVRQLMKKKNLIAGRLRLQIHIQIQHQLVQIETQQQLYQIEPQQQLCKVIKTEHLNLGYYEAIKTKCEQHDSKFSNLFLIKSIYVGIEIELSALVELSRYATQDGPKFEEKSFVKHVTKKGRTRFRKMR